MKIGDMVMWVGNVPDSWRFIYTNAPMKIIGEFYHSGGGFCNIKPGMIYTVEYTNDSKYYDPDVRFPGEETKAQMMIHEMWLQSVWGESPMKIPWRKWTLGDFSKLYPLLVDPEKQEIS